MKYDFEKAREEIGYTPYATTINTNIRMDKWALKILKEIRDLKKEIRNGKNN